MISSPIDIAELLSRLIRFDTTNPPGSEGGCVRFLADLLGTAGISTKLYSRSPDRPNLIARLPGRAEAPPLLLYGHVDVVTTAGQAWSHPPFEGRIIDGSVWGRGALDMKGGIAMMVSALLRAKEEGLRPAGDIVLAIVADEEAGGADGARFLVEHHPDALEGVRFALGEFGGFPLHLGGRRFYMIQVAEKQPCWLETTLRGRAGHGARPMHGEAMATLGRVLSALDKKRTPIHITPVTRRTIATIARHVSRPKGFILRRLLQPQLTDRILGLLGSIGRTFEPLFRHTVNATVVHGGEKPNVIPSEIVLGLDARILPGFDPEDLLDELRRLIGTDLGFRVLYHDTAPPDSDLGLFDTLGEVLRELDRDAIPVPFLLPGSTDARLFSQLGIQSYGFTPMSLPAGLDFFSTIHAADERIPVEALDFGANAILRVIERYGSVES